MTSVPATAATIATATRGSVQRLLLRALLIYGTARAVSAGILIAVATYQKPVADYGEVVPGLVELEVAVPRPMPAVR